jgi:hypothetical protein
MTMICNRSERMKIYLASSWRNGYRADILAALRAAGHDVYDFTNPAHAFSWKQIEPTLRERGWSAVSMREALAHPISQRGFSFDHGAMVAAHACVLLLPCGMSAHLEAGWMGGMGKPVAVLAPEVREPELMYKLFDNIENRTPLFGTVAELITYLSTHLDEAFERCESCGKRIRAGDVFRWADDVTTCRSTCSPRPGEDWVGDAEGWRPANGG